MFNKEAVSHAALVAAGKISIRFTSEPIKSAFKKNGRDAYAIGFALANKPHRYQIENEAIRLKLASAKRTGHVCDLTATGIGEEADLDIYDAAGPLATPPQQPAGKVREEQAEEGPKPRMRLKTITYGRTINLGNYENFRLELTVELEPGDDSNAAIKTLTEAVDTKCAFIQKKKQNQPHS